MFRAIATRLAVSPYTLFMIEQKGNPAFKGLAIGRRGKLTAKLYKALSPVDRASLEKRASKMKAFKRKKPARAKPVAFPVLSLPRASTARPSARSGKKKQLTKKRVKKALRGSKVKRTASAYIRFVRQHASSPSIRRLAPSKRPKALSKLWKQQKSLLAKKTIKKKK